MRVGVAEGEDARDLGGRFDERDRVGQVRRLGVLAVRVVLAQGGVGGQALAQQVAGGGDDGFERGSHGGRGSGTVLRGGL